MDIATSEPDELAERLAMIRQSAETLLEREGGVKRARKLRFNEAGSFDHGAWRRMCATGWTGLRVASEFGGAGLGLQEVCAVAEQLGRKLAPEPFCQSVMCAPLLAPDSLPGFLDGTQVVLPAWQERVNDIVPVGDAQITSNRISGRKIMVLGASQADMFLVTTRQGLALVARDSGGLSLERISTQDGGQFGTLVLSDVAPVLAWQPAIGCLEAALDDATLATCAYLLGAMESAFELTLEYIKTRAQFGQAIGAFQAVQHRAADMHIQLSLARASLESAAAVLDRGCPDDFRAATVSRAKARLSEASVYVTKEAIQLHGAIGYTDEYDVGLFLRKVLTLANFHGSAHVHRQRFARLYPEDQDE